jgi:YbbR domain-containing protein
MRNFTLKILSILIALLLSFYIKSESNISTAEIIVPVDIRDLPDNKVVVWQFKRQVSVEVKGPTFLVNRLLAAPPTLKIKLPDQEVSKYSAPINKGDLEISDPLQVVSVDPPTISFSIEKKLQKEVPIKTSFNGQLPREFKIVNTSIYPETVTVVGPESEVSGIKSIQTAAIELKDLKESFKDDVSIRVPGKLTQSSASSVKVSLEVASLDQKKLFKDVPLEVRQSGNTIYKLSNRTIDVIVLGIKSELEELGESKIIPYIKIPRDYNGNNLELPITVEVPEGFLVVSTKPEKITVLGGKNSK